MNWQNVKKAVMEHVWGPIGSAIFHIILILVLVNVAMQTGEQQAYSTQEVVMDVNEANTPPPDEKQMDDQIKPPEKQQDLSTLPADMPTIGQNDDASASDAVAGNDRGPADLGFGGKEGTTANGLDMASTIKSPLILRGIAKGYGGRFGKAGLGRGGARSKAIDDAITRALRWLKTNQRADGGWAYGGNLQGSGGNDVAVSGLALLCFLAYGKTTSDTEFGPTVEKAINFIKLKQNAEGYFAAIKAENAPGPYPYVHGIATYAICEAYGMTRIPDLQTVMDKAVRIIIAGQQKDTGGWDYQYAKGARRDTSVAAWQVQSLKAALIAGCTVPGIKEALDNSVKDMKKVFDPKSGKFGYEKAGSGSMGMTGAATLCLQFTGHSKDVEAMSGLRAMKTVQVSWETGGGESWPLYAFYYITQCRFQESKESFAAWQQQFVPAYLKAQDPDGHWPGMGGKGDENKHGPVYTTTFGCLTLETFVRFLPSYQHVEDSAPAAAPVDDVVVKVL
jgi:hypothetical protein